MIKYLLLLCLWLFITLVLAAVLAASPGLFIANDYTMALGIMAMLFVIIFPAVCILLLRDNWRKKRFLRPLTKELKSQGKQNKKNFLTHFSSEQQQLANLLRNAFASHILVSPKYLHHDTPCSKLPLVRAFDFACYHSQHLGPLAPHLEDDITWWNRCLEHLQKKDDTLKGLVQFFIKLDRRLGEVLADVELPITQKGVGEEEGGEIK